MGNKVGKILFNFLAVKLFFCFLIKKLSLELRMYSTCHYAGKLFVQAIKCYLKFCGPNVLVQKVSKLVKQEKIKRNTMVFWYHNCSDLLWEKIILVIKKTFKNRGWRLRICKNFEITKTIYSNSELKGRIECFFNLFLEVSQI